MKLYALIVYSKTDDNKVLTLRAAFDLKSFSFYQRSSVQEFMLFTGKIVAERSAQPSRSSVKEQDYMCHCNVRTDGLAAVLVSDTEYPQRVAFTMLSKVCEDFIATVPAHTWMNVVDQNAPYDKLPEFLARYQDPTKADAMSRVQEEIDQTKIVMHNTIAAVLDRGEKLDDLVEKSENLSAQSKMFYTQARKMNKCCNWV